MRDSFILQFLGLKLIIIFVSKVPVDLYIEVGIEISLPVLSLCTHASGTVCRAAGVREGTKQHLGKVVNVFIDLNYVDQ